MKRPKRKRYNRVTLVNFKLVPADLYAHWKAVCARRKVAMVQAFIEFMRKEVHEELRARAHARREIEAAERGHAAEQDTP